MKIFVAGLPYDLDDAELEEIFEKFGTIVSAKVAIDKETGKSKGFAFVEMADRNEAMNAISALDGQLINGRPIAVKEAEQRENRTPNPRTPNGDFNQKPREPRTEGGFPNREPNILPISLEIPANEPKKKINKDKDKRQTTK